MGGSYGNDRKAGIQPPVSCGVLPSLPPSDSSCGRPGAPARPIPDDVPLVRLSADGDLSQISRVEGSIRTYLLTSPQSLDGTSSVRSDCPCSLAHTVVFLYESNRNRREVVANLISRGASPGDHSALDITGRTRAIRADNLPCCGLRAACALPARLLRRCRRSRRSARLEGLDRMGWPTSAEELALLL